MHSLSKFCRRCSTVYTKVERLPDPFKPVYCPECISKLERVENLPKLLNDERPKFLINWETEMDKFDRAQYMNGRPKAASRAASTKDSNRSVHAPRRSRSPVFKNGPAARSYRQRGDDSRPEQDPVRHRPTAYRTDGSLKREPLEYPYIHTKRSADQNGLNDFATGTSAQRYRLGADPFVAHEDHIPHETLRGDLQPHQRFGPSPWAHTAASAISTFPQNPATSKESPLSSVMTAEELPRPTSSRNAIPTGPRTTGSHSSSLHGDRRETGIPVQAQPRSADAVPEAVSASRSVLKSAPPILSSDTMAPPNSNFRSRTRAITHSSSSPQQRSAPANGAPYKAAVPARRIARPVDPNEDPVLLALTVETYRKKAEHAELKIESARLKSGMAHSDEDDPDAVEKVQISELRLRAELLEVELKKKQYMRGHGR